MPLWPPARVSRCIRPGPPAVGALNAPVVHLGYRYDSRAVVDPRPQLPSTEVIPLDLDGTPGSRLPHAWLERTGRRLSTLDLARSRRQKPVAERPALL
jgi:hypothetical protein